MLPKNMEVNMSAESSATESIQNSQKQRYTRSCYQRGCDAPTRQDANLVGTMTNQNNYMYQRKVCGVKRVKKI